MKARATCRRSLFSGRWLDAFGYRLKRRVASYRCLVGIQPFTGVTRFSETGRVWAEKPPSCGLIALPRRRSPSGSRRPSRRTVVRTNQKLRQFQPVPKLQKQLYSSKVHAKRLSDLGQTIALAGVGVTPSGAAFQFVQNVGPGFRVCFNCELVPDIFDQLQSFKPAQMFNGLQCGFHAGKSNSGPIW